jgi:hypothetical protein
MQGLGRSDRNAGSAKGFPFTRAIWLAAMLLVIAGCSRTTGSFDVDDSGQTKWTNLVALVQFKPIPKSPQPFAPIKCPEIGIQDGTADDRVYASGDDQSNANVRYQFSIINFARDCQVVDKQYQMKVGVEGRVLLGPAGAPGTFDAPIRVAIISRTNGSATVSKLYQVPAAIGGDQTEGPFTLVTDALSVPVTSQFPDQDYVIKIGFDSTANAGAGHAVRHHHAHPAAAAAGAN